MSETNIFNRYIGENSSFPSSIHGLPFDQKSSIYIRTPYSGKNAIYNIIKLNPNLCI